MSASRVTTNEGSEFPASRRVQDGDYAYLDLTACDSLGATSPPPPVAPPVEAPEGKA